MNSRKRIAVIAGGFSSEYVISERSAQLVMDNIDRSRFDPFLVLMKDENWTVNINGNVLPINKGDFSFEENGKQTFDAAFIIIHGTPGENGVLQGYLDLIGLPYTTGGVDSLALTFHKFFCNQFIKTQGFKVAEAIMLVEDQPFNEEEIIQKLGLPCFVKPNAGGSSFGTTKVKETSQLADSIKFAFKEDQRIILESFLDGMEVTCGVIPFEGGIKALPITEIVSKGEFFDFEAKYEGNSEEITPARISESLTTELQEISEKLYHLTHSKGMIRIDFMIVNDEPYVIEINSVPGFSAESIIPQQARAAGIDTTALISHIIDGSI